MTKSLPNYIRMFRRQSGLSQDEIGVLLGGLSETAVVRHESFKRMPPLETALCYSLMFRVDPRELFAGVFESVETELAERAEDLLAKLPPSSVSRGVEAKRLFLEGILAFEEPHIVPCEE